MQATLPKAYQPAEHEPRIRRLWDDANAFHADPGRVTEGGARPYAIVIPPPNVTAALHLGHALNNTLQDILIRAHRMMGDETVWLPGTDHAGIATQTVVDKRLRAEGKPALAEHKQMELAGEQGREKFIGLVQDWKDEYEATITNQLKEMGCSCDWQRQRFTMDPVCAGAVREAFFQLFRNGLIYRGKRLVNWDPVTKTALADDEVDMIEVEGHFWYLRYPICDAAGNLKSAKLADGSTIDHVTVATTRPETYLGDTAVAINPKDPKASALKGLCCKLPYVNRVIPIIEDDYVVLPAEDPDAPGVDPKAKYASGFLKVTPAHDPNDWLIGQRHDLGVINVMAEDASISGLHGWDDVGDAGRFVGLSREDARTAIVEAFERDGLLAEVRPYTHSVGHSYRSHAPVEPYLSDQWYVKVTDPRLAGSAQRALKAEQRSTESLRIQRSGAGFHPAVPAGINADLHRTSRRLPHWEKGGSTYFVTFRSKNTTLNERERQITLDACKHWHGERAIIHRVVVMPDHVHIVLTPLRLNEKEWHPLNKIIGGIKRHAAKTINEARGATGSLWQDEYFDRLIRNEMEFEEKLEYIWSNPRRAGLVADPAGYPFQWRPGSEEFITGGDGGMESRPTTESDIPGDGDMTFYPDRYAQTYESWHDNIRDWCISRQLWWGHRIPVWSRPLDQGAVAPVAMSDTIAVAEMGESLQVCLRRDDPRVIGQLEAAGFTQDPDVLDTWFSSALWPLSTMGWPDAAQDPSFDGMLDAFNPTSVLCTAREIITLWVSRMVMFNRFFTGQNQHDPAAFIPGRLPFHDVFIHAMIQDGEGRKMSKSLGNGVDPLDIIHTHGSDAMRFTLCQMTTQTQDMRMPVEFDEAHGMNTSPKFDLGKRFCNKLWNAARFTLMMIDEAEPGADDSPDEPRLIDRWMLSRVESCVRQCESALRTYQFSVYAQAMYDLVWRDFCDWYLEAVKPTVKRDPKQRAALRTTLECVLRLLQPVCPFVTQAIAESVNEVETPDTPGVSLGKADLLCLAPWPDVAGDLRDEAAEAAFDRLRSLIESIRDARTAQQVHPRRRVTLHCDAALAGEIAAGEGLVETIAGLGSVTTGKPEGESVAFVFEAVEHRLSDLADAVDAGVERERLTAQIADLDKSIKTLEGRLNNPGYVDKAPEKLVNESRAQLASLRSERDAAARSLGRLG
jgi:valyl-tRNA synthetase